MNDYSYKMSGESKTWLCFTAMVLLAVFAVSWLIFISNREQDERDHALGTECIRNRGSWVIGSSGYQCISGRPVPGVTSPQP